MIVVLRQCCPIEPALLDHRHVGDAVLLGGNTPYEPWPPPPMIAS
jgi:hypothetical protein